MRVMEKKKIDWRVAVGDGEEIHAKQRRWWIGERMVHLRWKRERDYWCVEGDRVQMEESVGSECQ